jgi:hypothetical protein
LTAKIADKPRYQVIGQLKRFNQKCTVLSRTAWDPSFQKVKEIYQRARSERIQKEHSLESYAFRDASWYVANTIGTFAGFMHGNDGLYSWKSLEEPKESLDSKLKFEKPKTSNPTKMSAKIKSAARFYGADLIGITRLNDFWVYSHSYNSPD